MRRLLACAAALVVLAGSACGSAGDSADDESTTTTTAFVPRHFSIAAVGDILLHNYVITDGQANAKGKPGVAYDFDPMFAGVKDLISTPDLALCHQETPISTDNKNLTVPRTLSFNAPKEIATALKNAGFDGCDTASNHTWDRQLSGVNQTLKALDDAGVKHAGSGRDQKEMDTPPVFDVKGVQVGHLAFTYTIFNEAGPSTKVPDEAPWLKSMSWPAIGKEGILAQAKKLKERGAQFVVVSMHWGDQYLHEPNAQQRQLAKDLLSSPDVDLILGDHVHVVQPCEKIGDKYVTYGLGNFLSNQSPNQDSTLVNANQDGTLQTFTVDETAPGAFKVTKMTFAPTWVVIQGHKIVPATPDKYKDSYNRTVKNMNLLGPGACDAVPAY